LLAEQQGVDPEQVPREDVVAHIREENDLPERVGDTEVDAALDAALAALADGDIETAADELSLLVTPCAAQHPSEVAVGRTGEHSASCLRLTDDHEPVEAVDLQ
jgi:hypothetical protein